MNKKLFNQQKLIPWLFISPFFVLFLIFGLFPFFYGIFLSMHEWRGARAAHFTGLSHYAALLSGADPHFWKTAGTTVFLFFACFLPQHLIALPLAILLNNSRVQGKNLFFTVYVLPFIAGTVSLTAIFVLFCNYNNGLFNHLLKNMGFSGLNWMQNSRTLPLTAALFINWRYLGLNTLIYFAGLQTIPPEYYEAAIMDGAGNITRHIYVSLPMMFPVIFFAVSMSMLAGAQLFTEPFLMTAGYAQMGGSGSALFTVSFYIMWLLQREMNWGKGAAVSVLFFIICSVILICGRRLADWPERLQKAGTK